MGMYYYIYTPDFKMVDEGKFVGMPFFRNDLPFKFTSISTVNPTYGCIDSYDELFVITYDQAIQLKDIKDICSDLFIDLMKENSCNGLLIKTG